jgi:uncharacterized NAD(P)/FAD-binding protein YdhS
MENQPRHDLFYSTLNQYTLIEIIRMRMGKAESDPTAYPTKVRARSIAIVGGGASGALIAAHVLRDVGDNVRLTLIEPRAQLGRGLAYSTQNESHRLNVRASNMSAFPDEPDHFWRWLRAEGHAGEDRFCFVPRLVYGRYLASLIETHLTEADPPRLRWLREAVVGLAERDGSVTLRFGSGETAEFDIAILCCGHEPSEHLAAPFIGPWKDPRAWNDAPDSTILILGTGLTMVDAAISLGESGHRGPIVALSRRGLLPQAHRRVETAPINESELPRAAKLGAFLRWLRARVRNEMQRGGDWRSVIDGLRPHTRSLWQTMPDDARKRFIEHARPWWDIHRHRMAPEIETKIEALRTSGQLRTLSGRIVHIDRKRDGASVSIRPRGSAQTLKVKVSRIVSCRGLTNDPRESANPLVAQLLADGQARVDPLGIGLDVDDDCALIDAGGRASARVFAVGPMSQAAFWESIAVPDIRLQAASLATRLRSVGLVVESLRGSEM